MPSLADQFSKLKEQYTAIKKKLNLESMNRDFENKSDPLNKNKSDPIDTPLEVSEQIQLNVSRNSKFDLERINRDLESKLDPLNKIKTDPIDTPLEVKEQERLTGIPRPKP